MRKVSRFCYYWGLFIIKIIINSVINRIISTPNAVVALSALQVKCVEKWTTSDINQTLNVGDQLYLNGKLPHDQIYMSYDEVQNSIEIFGQVVNHRVGPGLCSNTTISVLDFRSNIEELLHTKNADGTDIIILSLFLYFSLTDMALLAILQHDVTMYVQQK
jgi:hypothetical protein